MTGDSMKTLTGIIHGKTIELFENLGLPDGEEVEIHVTVGQRTRRPGAGLVRSPAFRRSSPATPVKHTSRPAKTA